MIASSLCANESSNNTNKYELFDSNIDTIILLNLNSYRDPADGYFV